MTFDSYLASVAERAGEPCTVCPPWVVACTHLGKMILYLGDIGALARECTFTRLESGFDVGMTQCYATSRCGCTLADNDEGTVPYFATEPEARAEFERRAELLRQGAYDDA